MIDPNGSFSNTGLEKFSKFELVKVIKTFDDIMTTLGQVLLSHKTYHKTDPNNIIDNLQ